MDTKSKVVEHEIAEGKRRVPEALLDMSIRPWIGRDYDKGINGRRVLILGASHYSDWADKKTEKINQDFSISNVADQLSDEPDKTKFYKELARAFLGKAPTHEERRSFWNSVAFYNYVQEIVVGGASDGPTPEQWRAGKPVFLKALSAIKPDIVFVCGEQIWNKLPPAADDHPELPWNIVGEKIYRCGYKIADLMVEAIRIKHPSIAFSADKWHAVLTVLLDPARLPFAPIVD